MRCFRLLVVVPLVLVSAILINAVVARTAEAQNAKGKRAAATASLTFPPKLPGAELVVTDTSPTFLIAPETLGKDVAIAQTPPTVDFLYYPGQNYEGKPWSNWGTAWLRAGNTIRPLATIWLPVARWAMAITARARESFLNTIRRPKSCENSSIRLQC